MIEEISRVDGRWKIELNFGSLPLIPGGLAIVTMHTRNTELNKYMYSRTIAYSQCSQLKASDKFSQRHQKIGILWVLKSSPHSKAEAALEATV